MTDNEIIRALECCYEESECVGCPYRDSDGCTKALNNDVIDLINRQKAEIERLRGWQDLLKAEKHSLIKAEAIKEFAERLKVLNNKNLILWNEHIDNLVKEMVGEE